MLIYLQRVDRKRSPENFHHHLKDAILEERFWVVEFCFCCFKSRNVILFVIFYIPRLNKEPEVIFAQVAVKQVAD